MVDGPQSFLQAYVFDLIQEGVWWHVFDVQRLNEILLIRFLVDNNALLRIIQNCYRKIMLLLFHLPILPTNPIPCFLLSLLSNAASNNRFQILEAPTSLLILGRSASGRGSCQLGVCWHVLKLISYIMFIFDTTSFLKIFIFEFH